MRKKPHTPLYKAAQVFCIAAHAAVGQRRKYTGEPYHLHPFEVVELLDCYVSDGTLTEEMRIAALLHDVVEDTHVTLDLIEDIFGAEVAGLVGWLTDVSKPEDGNRATRKAMDREHSAMAPPQAQTIKLADLISNTLSISKHDPDFLATYIREIRQLLEVMTDGNHNLYKRAHKIAYQEIEP